MEKNDFQKSDSGMMLVITFFVLFVVNCVVLWLANMLFPTEIVLGTGSIPYMWAVGHSMGALALICTFAIPFVRELENNRKRMLTTNEWMVIYFLLNLVGIWLIGRGAAQFGMGISSWMVAVVFAVVLDVVQVVAMMQLQKKAK